MQAVGHDNNKLLKMLNADTVSWSHTVSPLGSIGSGIREVLTLDYYVKLLKVSPILVEEYKKNNVIVFI